MKRRARLEAPRGVLNNQLETMVQEAVLETGLWNANGFGEEVGSGHCFNITTLCILTFAICFPCRLTKVSYIVSIYPEKKSVKNKTLDSMIYTFYFN